MIGRIQRHSFSSIRPPVGSGFAGLESGAAGVHKARNLLRQPLLERAIGVIYRPETERLSHYFHTRLAEQFDVVIHFGETRAVEPLERTSRWEAGEAPETFSLGF